MITGPWETRVNDVSWTSLLQDSSGPLLCQLCVVDSGEKGFSSCLSMKPFFHGSSYKLSVPGITVGKLWCGNLENGDTRSVFGVQRRMRDNQERAHRVADVNLEDE